MHRQLGRLLSIATLVSVLAVPLTANESASAQTPNRAPNLETLRSANHVNRTYGVHPGRLQPAHHWRKTEQITYNSGQQSMRSSASKFQHLQAQTATADPCNAKLSGKVTEASNTQMFGTPEVDIYQLSGTASSSATYTDYNSSGAYSFTGLCAGTYTLRFQPQSTLDAYQWWGNRPSDLSAVAITVAKSASVTGKNISLPLAAPIQSTYYLQGFPKKGLSAAGIYKQLWIVDNGQTENLMPNATDSIYGNGAVTSNWQGLPAGTYYEQYSLAPTAFSLPSPPPASSATTSPTVAIGPSGGSLTAGTIVWTGDPNESSGGNNPSLTHCSCSRGDPVDTQSGDLVESATDLTLPGVGPAVRFSRNYISSRSTIASPVGNGWSSILNERLTDSSGNPLSGTPQSIQWTQEDGSSVMFYLGSDGNYYPDAQVHVTVSIDPNSGSWTVTRNQTQVFTFDSTGVLDAESDLNKNTVTLNHDATSGLVTSITGSGGRSLMFTYNTANLVSKIADNAARSVSFTYDASNNLTAVKDASSKTTKYAYNTAGLLSSLTNPLNGVTKTTYDGSNRVVSQTDPISRQTTFSYGVSVDGNDSVTTTTAPDGSSTQDTYDGPLIAVVKNLLSGSRTFETDYSYDGSHNLSSTVNGDGVTDSYTYDSSGNVLTKSVNGVIYSTTTYNSLNLPTAVTLNSLSRTTSDTYDSAGNKLSETDPANNVQAWTYNADGSIATYTDKDNKSTSYTYSSLGLEASKKEADGITTKYTYTTAGYLASVTDGISHKTSYTVDAFGRETSQTDPLGKKTTFTHDGLGDLLVVTDALSAATTRTYNVAGELTSIKDATGATTTYVPTGVANIDSQVTDASGHATKFAYDALHHLAAVTDALGHTTSYSYSSTGHLLTETDALGNQHSYQYNGIDYETGTNDALGNSTASAVDDAGEVTSQTDALNRQTQMTYSPNGLLTAVQLQTGAKESYGYDSEGRLTKFTDADGGVTSYSYDASGLLLSKTVPGGLTTGYSYDPAGQLTGITLPDKSVQTDTYDADGRLTKTHSTIAGSTDVTYTYDADGDRSGMTDPTGASSYTYDGDNRILTSKNGAGLTVSYTYTPIGKPLTIAYPGTSKTATYAYDADGQMTGVTDWNNKTTTFGWTANGELQTVADPNGVTETHSYDADGQAKEIKVVNGSTSLGDYTDGWDAAGELTSDASTDSVGSNVAHTYTYDGLGQLASVAGSGTTGSVNSTAAGSLTQQASGTSLQYNQAEELATSTPSSGPTTSYSYSSTGNRVAQTVAANGSTPAATSTYAFNPYNDLTAATLSGGTTVSYGVDGDGLRETRTSSGTSMQWTWDTATSLPLLLDDSTNSYLYGPGTAPIAQIGDSSGTTTYLHSDILGSPRVLTSSTGTVAGAYQYGSYGNVTSHSGSTSAIGFSGNWTDPITSLIYMRARDYDSATGQFMQVDPLTDQTHQRYAYAKNAPTYETDPTGLVTGGGCGGVDLGAVWGVSLQLCPILFALSDKGELEIGGTWTIGTGPVIGGNADLAFVQQVSDAQNVEQLGGPFLNGGGTADFLGGATLNGFVGSAAKGSCAPVGVIGGEAGVTFGGGVSAHGGVTNTTTWSYAHLDVRPAILTVSSFVHGIFG